MYKKRGFFFIKESSRDTDMLIDRKLRGAISDWSEDLELSVSSNECSFQSLLVYALYGELIMIENQKDNLDEKTYNAFQRLASCANDILCDLRDL